MFHSLRRSHRRRAYAQPVDIPGAGDRPSPIIDLDDEEIVQLAHDLRNHLTIMMLCVNAIRADVPQHQAERVSELHHAAEQAVLLINRLLADERPATAARMVVDVNQAVRAVAATLLNSQDDAIRLQLNLCAEPLAVRAEPGALERILLNLGLNAVDAMPHGGVLTIETAVVHARTPILGMPTGGYARLTIRDTGYGMTAGVKERMFDPFFTTKKTGTGLGLRSVAFTVQQLQGRISVESEPGSGTSVTAMLPLATEPSVVSFRASDTRHLPRN